MAFVGTAPSNKKLLVFLEKFKDIFLGTPADVTWDDFSTTFDQGDFSSFLELAVVDLLLNRSEYLVTQSFTTGFDYFCDCFERAYRIKHQSRHHLHETFCSQAMEVVTKFAGLSLISPSLFYVVTETSAATIRRRLNGDGFPSVLVAKIIASLSPTDFKKVFVDSVIAIRNTAQPPPTATTSTPTIETLQPLLLPLSRAFQFPEIINTIAVSPEWLPKCDARTIGRVSFLGPLLSLSYYYRDNPQVAADLLKNVSLTSIPPEAQKAIEESRTSLNLMRNMVNDVVVAFVATPNGRQSILSYFQTIISLNKGRPQLHSLLNDVPLFSCDGFLDNVLVALLKLCSPVTTTLNPKYELIDGGYVTRSYCRIDINKEETIAPPSQILAHVQTGSMITESIFLSLACLHVGFAATCARNFHVVHGPNGLVARVRSLTDQIEMLPAVLRSQAEAEIRRHSQTIIADIINMHDNNFLNNLVDFYAFISNWILSIIDPKKMGYPLPDEVPTNFGCWPRYILLDFAEILLFIATFAQNVLDSSPVLAPILRCILVLLSNHKYANMVDVRSKFIEFLAKFMDVKEGTSNRVRDFLSVDAFAIQVLTPTLVKFYVEIEEADPYAKYGKRHQVSLILKSIWKNHYHRDSLLLLTRGDGLFVRLVLLLINDTTYLLDESRSYLGKIMAEEEIIRNSVSNSREATTAAENRQRFSNICKTYTTLAKDTTSTFVLLTRHIVDPFLRNELVHRLVAMLNFNLCELLLTNSVNMKESECIKHGFVPDILLYDFILIYLHLSCLVTETHDPVNIAFLDAVVNDERSFKLEVFQRAVYVLESRNIITADLITRVHELISLLEEALERKAAHPAELTDIPDEFLDPLMATLMRDPVILPSSKMTVDRAVIESHLLDTANDPFNRSPLTIADLVPDVELKARIDAWLAEKQAEGKK